MAILLLVVALTLLISALCSLFEATLYSTRVVSLEAARSHGRHSSSAEHFLRLKKHIAVPTSAILILNTSANTAGATIAGMLAADELGAGFIPVFSGLLTLAILMFSEILPKTFGATHWKSLWPIVVWPLLFLEKVLRPLIWLTQAFSNLFVGKQPASNTTEEEIIAMIRMSATSGELTETEYKLLTAVFRFDESKAKDIMFPRRDAVFFDTSWDAARCLRLAVDTKHTRYPLCDGDMDNLRGFVHVKDLLACVEDKSVDIKSLARPLERVAETTPVRELLAVMRMATPHMVAVIDELGTTVGLVTLENVLEQLVGSVQDEFDGDGPDINIVDEGHVLVRGAVPLARLRLELDLELPSTDASTLSGLLVSELGRLPRVGDSVAILETRATVLEVKNDRATQIRLDLDGDVAEEPESSDTQ